MKLRELIDRVVADGIITPDEHRQIVDAVCDDPAVSEEERTELARIRQLIDEGKVRFASSPASESET